MATPAAAAAAKEVDKKVQLMKEIRAHEVAIGELNNLPPSRAVYQKTCNLFFRKSVKSAVTSEQRSVNTLVCFQNPARSDHRHAEGKASRNHGPYDHVK
ncbi:hypothetical protein OsI_25859 [Oryza sativa Indica Group]|uniref:Uncharacterized protein n=1 Tax=Oryza sativa subsp. indica TaxID=39946 RepID=B8B5Q6_ORYSI|nr:hypothetical protein OsI_25859 [Oryza sativa Indica Group]